MRGLCVLLIACLAASCTVRPRTLRPRVAPPAVFLEAPVAPFSDTDRRSLERWWTAFHDPLLDHLIAQALDRNLDLRMAGAHVREARAARGIAAAAARPRIDVTGAAARAHRGRAVPPAVAGSGADSASAAGTHEWFEAGLAAGWELDVFGGVKQDVEASVAEVEAAEESRRDVLVTLVADVARTYAELRGAQRQLEIVDATLQSQRETRDIVQARFDAGLGTALDVDRAEGLLNATASRRPELARTAKTALYGLALLLGTDAAAIAPALETTDRLKDLPDVPATLPSELLSRRPDLRHAEREVAAATARTGVARADLFPRFAIPGTIGRRSGNAPDLTAGDSGFWSIIPGVRWPILSGGRIRANIRVQDARQEQAVIQYEKAVLAAIDEVEGALVAHARERERLEFLRASVTANQRAVDLATERYRGGLEPFLSVLDAQRALYAATEALTEGETRATVTLIILYKALGGGWTPDERLSAGGSVR
jgi:multidrug efflux system outer membrane protein